MSWLNFKNTENGESVMEQKVVVAPKQEEKTIVHIQRLMGSHPSAQINASKPFEISKIENGVVLRVNKQAKQPDGEGPQIAVTAGDRISQAAAEQLSRHNKVIVTFLNLEA
jgi:hypothetical protein